MDLRELKALELAARAKITFVDGFWIVPSQTRPSISYRVTTAPPSCECEDFQLRQQPCKHVIAARLVLERNGGPQAPAIDRDEVPQKPTYQKNWPTYNLAQALSDVRGWPGWSLGNQHGSGDLRLLPRWLANTTVSLATGEA